MLAHLAHASRRPARSWLALAPRRQYAAKTESGPDDPFTAGPTYAKWLQTEGLKYKEAHRPKNWLGGLVPFPLNPSFKPPTPVSDHVRQQLWNLYMADPVQNSPRYLAQHYGFSIARVDAILRLKGLENQWKQKKPIQTGFLKGMEDALGVTAENRRALIPDFASQQLGEDANESDLLSQTIKDAARARYQRLFWEPVEDGHATTMSENLSLAAEHGALNKQLREAALLKRLRHLKFETGEDVVVERPGRPTLRFVDVGVKFVDVKDRLKRVHAAKRRQQLKRRHRASAQAVSSEQGQVESGQTATPSP